MGNFRKIHTIHSFSGFQGQGVGEGGGVASSNWESEGMGKTCVWNSECMGGGVGRVRSGISTRTDKSVFLENAFFMDLKSKA